MNVRRVLKFVDADACAAEVGRLQEGHAAVGRWSLLQACWHLKESMRETMHPTDSGGGRRRPLGWLMLKSALWVGRIPSGQPSPKDLLPPVNPPASAIDEMLLTLRLFATHRGPFSPHPLGGRLSPRDNQRFNLVHCAHHLGFFTPLKD